MTEKTFKILSIDGGGMRGIYSATILNNLEEKYGQIIDYFDMISGTSTGGIIALGLSLGLPAKKMMDFYQIYGPKIFRNHSRNQKWLSTIIQFFIRSKYLDLDLRKCLQILLQDHIINDSKCLLCIPITNASNYRGAVIKTPYRKEFTRDGLLKMVDVALATTAAPTYFPIAKLNDKELTHCVDGGLWSNNPALVGLIEAYSYFVGESKEFSYVSILSINNLYSDEGWQKTSEKRKASICKWREHIFSMVTNSQTQFAHDVLNILSQSEIKSLKTYTRISKPDYYHLKEEELNAITDLDNASDTAINLYKRLAEEQTNTILEDKDVQSFFNYKSNDWEFPIC